MSDPQASRGSHTPGNIADARAGFTSWVGSAGGRGRMFLQVLVRAVGEERFEILHHEDAQLPAGELEVHTDPYAAREIAQTTAAGEHRPLKTAPNLRRGWILSDLDARALAVAMDYLYPACVAHWHAGRMGTLRVTHWRETAGRQSGMYSAVGLLSDQAVRDTTWACCDDTVCLRRVAWRIDHNTELDVFPDDATDDASVPCPEACSLFVSLARNVLTLERRPRQQLPGLGSLGTEEIEQIRDIVAAAADGTLDSTREGDFAQGTNLRRIRHLAARLRKAEPPPSAGELPCEGCPRPVPCPGCPVAV